MEKVKHITRISDGKDVDLSNLSEMELKRLHYDEEQYIAKKLLTIQPFSEDRTKLLNKGYEMAINTMAWYLPSSIMVQGASSKSIELVCRIIKKQKHNVVLYEGGVGQGLSCEAFLKYPNVELHGCDVTLSEHVRYLITTLGTKRVHIEEKTLYDGLLGMENNSIDVFYADNVFEHLIPDEFAEIMRRLNNKMKTNGLMILFIPNRIVGPSDVTRYFAKIGDKAQGFHFMEQSYSDVIHVYAGFGFLPEYVVCGGIKKYHIIKDHKGRLNRQKIRLEKILGMLPKNRILRKLFSILAMDCYILRKYKQI